MRAWVLSDLHVDRQPVDLGPHPEHDVILMAGDLCDGGFDPREWLTSTFSPEEMGRLVYVEGNHDRYGLGLDVEPPHIGLLRSLGARAGTRGLVVVGDQRIVYATLWSDIDIPVEGESLGDFRRIPGLTQRRWRDAHRRDLEWLVATVRPSDVVMTHHAPSYSGLHPRMADDPSRLVWASSYASRLEEEMVRLAPSMWIFGHTHIASSWSMGGIEVVSNARGRGAAPHFDPALVVDLRRSARIPGAA